jgi:hypothetical protein
MHVLHSSWRALLNDILLITCVFGSTGIALKFVYFQVVLNLNLYAGNVVKEVIFPFFPNLLDSVVLILSAVYFVVRLRLIERRLKRGA